MRKRTILFGMLALLLLAALFPSGAFAESGVTEDVFYLERDGQRLFGKLYLPSRETQPLPLVILSHGLGSDHRIMEPYAHYFADSGIAACVFDYIGGSEESLSDGSMTEMSVLTEAADLNCVLDHFLGDSRFSEDEIFLFGGSQGGFISAYVAGQRSEDVAGLTLLYPAFNLQETALALVPEDGKIPDTAVIGKHTVGSVYIRDMMDFDIYEMLSRYTGPALLFHGTDDKYVPMAYVQRAAKELDAELIVVEGAGHGFTGEDRDTVAQTAVAFVRNAQARSGMQAA